MIIEYRIDDKSSVIRVDTCILNAIGPRQMACNFAKLIDNVPASMIVAMRSRHIKPTLENYRDLVQKIMHKELYKIYRKPRSPRGNRG